MCQGPLWIFIDVCLRDHEFPIPAKKIFATVTFFVTPDVRGKRPLEKRSMIGIGT